MAALEGLPIGFYAAMIVTGLFFAILLLGTREKESKLEAGG